MIKNKKVAADVSQVLQDTFDNLGKSLRQVSATCSEAEIAFYREKIGDIFYILVFGILEPLYQEHPELQPENWNERKI